MQFAADVPILTLVASGIVLVVCTTLLSVTFPAFRRPPRRRRARAAPTGRTEDAGQRLVVTGRPPALPSGPAPVAPTVRRPARQIEAAPNVHQQRDGLSEAEATIEHLLDTDPDRLARLMMNWIRTDDEPRDRRR